MTSIINPAVLPSDNNADAKAGSNAETHSAVTENAADNSTLWEDFAVDWDDFVLTTLNDPSVQQMQDDFPLYLFFARVPEEDSAVSVYGYKTDSEDAYSAILLRAACMDKAPI